MQLLYVGPLLVHAASSDPVITYAGALTTKFGRDMLVGLLTLYTAEVSQAWTRAFFIGIYQLAFYTGVTVARFLPDSTQMTIFLSIMLDAAALGLSASAPETPHYLVMTDQPDEAEELMQALWFDAGDEEATALLDKAELYADEYSEGVFPIVMSSRFAVPLAICFFLSMANYHICDLFFKPTRYAADAYGYPYMDLLFTVVFPGIPLKKLMTDMFHIAGCFIYLFLCFLIKRRTLFLFSVFASLAYGFMALLAPLGPKVLILVYSCTMWERMGLRQLGYTLPAEVRTLVRNFGNFWRHTGQPVGYPYLMERFCQCFLLPLFSDLSGRYTGHRGLRKLLHSLHGLRPKNLYDDSKTVRYKRNYQYHCTRVLPDRGDSYLLIYARNKRLAPH